MQLSAAIFQWNVLSAVESCFIHFLFLIAGEAHVNNVLMESLLLSISCFPATGKMSRMSPAVLLCSLVWNHYDMMIKMVTYILVLRLTGV